MYINRLWILISLVIPTNTALIFHDGKNVTNKRIQVTHGERLHVICRGGRDPNWMMGANNLVTGTSVNVYQIMSPVSSVLVINSVKPSNVGTYTCHIGRIQESVTFATTSTPQPPLPSKIQGVVVSRTVQGSSPALRVSWSAVSGSGITYTVCYSTTSGTQSDPPSNANCGTSGITGTSTTLGSLSRGTTYYFWVAAVSSGGRGPYSDRRHSITYNAPGSVASFQVRSSSTIFGLIITWGPPSGSNYPTPVTYQLRYRERPSSGSLGSWRSTVQRTATQRQYTIPVLKPGTRYEVEVWAVSSIGRGQSLTRTETTYQLPGQVTSHQVRPSTTIFGLIIIWGPPSGSNYPTPVTYRLRYRERPSSGSPGGWNSTVQRTATQRQYTTPVLKPGTRYEVEVWAFVSNRAGTVRTMFGTTVSAPVQALNARLHGKQFALTVAWRPPTDITNPTGYRLRYRKTSSSIWSSTRTIGSQQTQYTITGLEEGATYEVEVWATFRSGEGIRRKFTARTTALSSAPSPANDNTAMIVGVLFGGIAIGVVVVLLVLGIVHFLSLQTVCKLRKWKKHPTSTETDPPAENKLRVDVIYEKVDEACYTDVTITTSPAYEELTIK